MTRRPRICVACAYKFTPMSSGQTFCRACLKMRGNEALIADIRAEIHGEWSTWLVGVITPHLSAGVVDLRTLHQALLKGVTERAA
jgi:hypothetical protein